MLRRKAGITLVALMVTIIVLLILAMVSVSLVLRGNIIEKANLAGTEYGKAEQKESGELDLLEAELDKYGNGATDVVTETDQKYFSYTLDEATKTATITGLNRDSDEVFGFNADGNYYCTAIKMGEEYITDIVIPSKIKENNTEYTVTAIGYRAFSADDGWLESNRPEENYSFTSFVIPDSVKSIGNEAFSGAPKLLNVKLPARLESIGSYAFHQDKSLESILIPSTVSMIRWSSLQRLQPLEYNN